MPVFLMKVMVDQARYLPVMDTMTGSTDAFVEVKFSDQSVKTSTKWSLDPVWHAKWTFEIPEEDELRSKPLILR